MITKTSDVINGLVTIHPPVSYDFRGENTEMYSRLKYQFALANGEFIDFVEDDISVSRYSVLRGLHGDDKTWKIIQCLSGDVYFVVVDMRKDSSTYRKWQSFSLSERNRMQVLVPAGCVNGHLCLSPQCMLSYKQSEYYTGAGKQITLRWNDPALNIYWPLASPILSQRDASAIFLKD